jgi:hypothetical protein
MACSIFCCCVITFKPLFGREGPLRRFGSRLSSHVDKSHLLLARKRQDYSGNSSSYTDIEGSGHQKAYVLTEVEDAKYMLHDPPNTTGRVSNQARTITKGVSLCASTCSSTCTNDKRRLRRPEIER